MKHGDNAGAPSYNAQISTESGNKIIVGTHLSQCSSDAASLMPAMDEVVKNLEKKPGQVVVDSPTGKTLYPSYALLRLAA